ncbi:uncharacterized protein LOC134821142 isoform X2 [Bolinopsis microptera]|uniref:uncharacterized protein LOC134821142 isoform X2 n=1 Tax=Bolinopsis microptera TaxID=2820187 RepID=UPI00307A53CD
MIKLPEIKELGLRTKEQFFSKKVQRALRNNNLLNEELKHSHATLEKRKERRNQITNHVKKVVSMSTKHVTSTNSWMSNHLNRCLLVLERGRHMQVTKPYYHAPGKPLTPYHTKRERQRLAEEEVNSKNIKEQSGIFLRFREPKRFSAGRDNCHVIELNKQLKFKAEK